MYPHKGQIWRFDSSNPFLISAKAPGHYTTWTYLMVTWVDNDNVYYRLENNLSRVEQTPLVRFMEVAELPNVSDVPDESFTKLLSKVPVRKVAGDLVAAPADNSCNMGFGSNVPWEEVPPFSGQERMRIHSSGAWTIYSHQFNPDDAQICTCLSDMASDAYSPGGPSSGQPFPSPCKLHPKGDGYKTPTIRNIHEGGGPIKD